VDSQEFFKQQLLQTLNNKSRSLGSLENISFVILPSNDPTETPKTTWDEIINWQVLPMCTEIRLSIDQVTDALASRQGLLPLWIRVWQQSHDLILLKISRRFRKMNVIRDYHREDVYLPFMLDKSASCEFTVETEKIGMTRKLLRTFQASHEERLFFEKYPLTFADIRYFADDYFKTFICFPLNLADSQTCDSKCKQLVIKRAAEFFVIENIDTTNENSVMKSTDLDLVLDAYLTTALDYTIDGVKITK
jgi:hypothetical protein